MADVCLKVTLKHFSDT